MDALKKIRGVLGCIFATGQLQVVFGKEVVGVYNAVLKSGSFSNAGEVAPAPTDGIEKDKEPMTFMRAIDGVISFVAGAVAPFVPALIGGGMLKVFLLLISYAASSFAASDTYKILGWVANAPFYFMPIFVAYGASTKLGGTPIYAMVCAAATITPEFMAAVASGTPLSMLGIPVRLVRKLYRFGDFGRVRLAWS